MNEAISGQCDPEPEFRRSWYIPEMGNITASTEIELNDDQKKALLVHLDALHEEMDKCGIKSFQAKDSRGKIDSVIDLKLSRG